METSKIIECPICGAGVEKLMMDSYVDFRLNLVNNQHGNLTVNLNMVPTITKEDIIAGIDDRSDTQEIVCTECGTIFPAFVRFDDDKKPEIFCNPDIYLLQEG